MTDNQAAPTPPTIRVEIDFRGLCMFVPGTNPAGKPVLHVLMPSTHHMLGMSMGDTESDSSGGHAVELTDDDAMNHTMDNSESDAPSGHAGEMTDDDGTHHGDGGDMPSVMEHLPRMVYSVDYGSDRSPVTPVFNNGVANLERIIDLPTGTVIDWSDRSSVTADAPVALPEQLIDLCELVADARGSKQDAAVKPEFLAAKLPANGACAARITLPGSVSITPYNFHDYKFGRENPRRPPPSTKPGSSTNHPACVLCVFEMNGPLLPFNVGGAKQLQETAGVIRVMFGNTIANDYQHPPVPFDTTGQRTHFWGFYELINKVPVDPSVPDVPRHLGAPSTTCTACRGSGGM